MTKNDKFILKILAVFFLFNIVMASGSFEKLNPNTYRTRSGTIGDGQNSSLAGTSLGNGTFWGIFNSTADINMNGFTITNEGSSRAPGSIFLVNSTTTTISTGYYDVEGLNGLNGTVNYVSLSSRYEGSINVSLMYNVSRAPVYPQDVIVTLNVTSGGFAENTTLSYIVANKGHFSAYINENLGGVNATNLGFQIGSN